VGYRLSTGGPLQIEHLEEHDRASVVKLPGVDVAIPEQSAASCRDRRARLMIDLSELKFIDGAGAHRIADLRPAETCQIVWGGSVTYSRLVSTMNRTALVA
jgi:hypothetical protein